jgi:HAD superfamily hydrolase (TIGR01490 family)
VCGAARVSDNEVQDRVPTLAVFDFDGTLTRRDSLLPFLRAVDEARLVRATIRAVPQLAGYALHLVPNWKAKEALVAGVVKGISEATLADHGVRFARDFVPGLLRPEARDRIRMHQERGDLLALVSASLEAYLIPWGRANGFEVVAGTRLEARHGILTGRLEGRNCWGAEKVARLRSEIGSLEGRTLVAYGDGKGDRELMRLASTAHWGLPRTR